LMQLLIVMGAFRVDEYRRIFCWTRGAWGRVEDFLVSEPRLQVSDTAIFCSSFKGNCAILMCIHCIEGLSFSFAPGLLPLHDFQGKLTS
jgi:hypothetical protein